MQPGLRKITGERPNTACELFDLSRTLCSARPAFEGSMSMSKRERTYDYDGPDWLLAIGIRVDQLVRTPEEWNRFREKLRDWFTEQLVTDKHELELAVTSTTTRQYAVLAAIHDVVLLDEKRIDLWRLHRREPSLAQLISGAPYRVLLSRVDEVTDCDRERLERMLAHVAKDLAEAVKAQREPIASTRGRSEAPQGDAVGTVAGVRSEKVADLQVPSVPAQRGENDDPRASKDKPEPEIGDDGLVRAAEKAYRAYKVAEKALGGECKDEAAYEYIREDVHGEFEDYRLPDKLTTWTRHLRTARSHYDDRKNKPRGGRSGRSTVSARDRDMPRNDA